MNYPSTVIRSGSVFLAAVTLFFGPLIQVNVDNFVRAETAAQIDRFLKMLAGGEANSWAHFRTPTAIDKQAVIRMNPDTLYSAIFVDISISQKRQIY